MCLLDEGVSDRFVFITDIPFLSLCGGGTERCVNLPDSGCVLANLCFARTLVYPPLVSLNNGTFVAFSAVLQFKDPTTLHSSKANICIEKEAFEHGALEIRIQEVGTTTTSNPITLHANPGTNVCWMQNARPCSVSMCACSGEGAYCSVN